MTQAITKVLLLDDDKQDYIIVRQMLAKVPEHRFHVDWVNNYEDALLAIKKNEHDAYLIDYLLGAESGLGLLEEQVHTGFKKPMIVLTAHGDGALDMKTIQMGAADYLPKKELSPAMLGRTILHAIERNLLMEKLYFQATHDELTGLYNRKFIIEQLSTLISSSKRHNFPLTFCLGDLDFFKAINDTHGHFVGDNVLRSFGEVLTEELRTEDIPGRYGGDEFCIVFPHSQPSDAEVSIERVRKSINNRIFRSNSGQVFHVTATFGVALLTKNRESASELITAADKALYAAKNSGRNRTFIFEEKT